MKKWLIVFVILCLGAVSAFHGTGFRLEDSGSAYTIRTLGGTALMRVDTNGRITMLDSESITIASGSTTPEGSITANTGSAYLRTSGGSGTTLYLKQSGTGTNTGWVPVTSGGADDLGNHTAIITLEMNTNRINQVGQFDYNWTTLLDGATPSLNGRSSLVNVGGTTQVTNFTGGTDGMIITVKLDSGESIANNSNIVTVSGTAISGPAMRTFVLDGSVWRETGTSGAADNLGNHIATTDLNMSNQDVASVGSLDFTPFTLTNSATPSVAGTGVAEVGGTTAINNFNSGTEGQLITVILDAGETINNTANIATTNGSDISGPTQRQFVLDGTVWREVGDGGDLIHDLNATTDLNSYVTVGRFEITANGITNAPSWVDGTDDVWLTVRAESNSSTNNLLQQVELARGHFETHRFAQRTSANGGTNWSAWTDVSGDNLGNHEATQILHMNENTIDETAVLAFKTAVSLADGATINVSGSGSKTTIAKVGGTTKVGDITGDPNQILILILDAGESIDDNTGIQLKDNADFEPTGLATIMLYNDNNTSWYEISRTLLYPP